jgi:hypothetical protein
VKRDKRFATRYGSGAVTIAITRGLIELEEGLRGFVPCMVAGDILVARKTINGGAGKLSIDAR